MHPSQQPSTSIPFPSARGVPAANSTSLYETLKARVLSRFQERLDPAKSRRMPLSLFQQTVRQQLEQAIEIEAPQLTRSERLRMLEEALTEVLGFGPLEELFTDPTVKEITVLGPHAVLVRRDQGWLPTNVKFRDADQLRDVLDKVRIHGDPVGPALPVSGLDMRLNNGFRVVAIFPPLATGQAPTAVFVRTEDVVAQGHSQPHLTVSDSHLPANSQSTTGSLTPPPSTTPLRGSGRVPVPPARSSATRSPAPGEHLLDRHRMRITERLIAKMSSLGVYDLSRVDISELRKVVAAFVEEYCRTERIYLSPTDQGRLTLEILTGMNR